MALPTFVAGASAGSATAADLPITKPTGTAADDVMLACLYRESTAAITPPTGWTQVTTFDQDTGGFKYRMNVYWLRAGGSEPANYTWTFASTWRTGVIMTLRGAITSGDPWDAFASAIQTQNADPTVGSITTLGADRLLAAFFSSFDGALAVWGPGASGMTERVEFEEIEALTEDFATEGATGAQTISVTGGVNPEYCVGFQIAIKPPAAGGDPEALLIGGKLVGCGLLGGVLVN